VSVEVHRNVIPAGPGNRWVREYLGLRAGRSTIPSTRVAFEGAGILDASLAHGAQLEAVLICPELARRDVAPLVRSLADAGVPTLRVTPRTFGRLTLRDGPDGVAAIARLRPVELTAVSLAPRARVLVLDRFEGAGNVGSLLRCADAAGVRLVLVTERRVRLNHPLIVKSSVGAVFSVPIASVTATVALEWLRARSFQLIAADPAAAVSFRDARYAPRVAVVLGSERHGLSPAWRSAADLLVRIPMAGRVDSLNAGHAGALFLYEVLRQHEPDGPGHANPAADGGKPGETGRVAPTRRPR
jgi:TrmH family RNA methyltransferase